MRTTLLRNDCVQPLIHLLNTAKSALAAARQQLAWSAAGWKTRFVDLEAETLVFERIQASMGTAEITADSGGRIARRRKFDLDSLWPAISGGSWPPSFTVSREQIYDESGRLTGGPQDEPA